MKIKYLLPLLIFSFWKCTPDREPVRFELEYFDKTFEVGPGLDPFETHFFTFNNMATRIEAYKSDFGVEDDDIVSILPRSMRFINVNTNDTYDFVNEISVKIFKPSEPNRKFEIFYHIPNGNRLSSALDLVPNENDLKDIMLEDRFSIEVSLVRFRDTPPTNFTTRVEMRFDVR